MTNRLRRKIYIKKKNVFRNRVKLEKNRGTKSPAWESRKACCTALHLSGRRQYHPSRLLHSSPSLTQCTSHPTETFVGLGGSTAAKNREPLGRHVKVTSQKAKLGSRNKVKGPFASFLPKPGMQRQVKQTEDIKKPTNVKMR